MRRTPLVRLLALEREEMGRQAQEERKRRLRGIWERGKAILDATPGWAKQIAQLASAGAALYGALRRPVLKLAGLYQARSAGAAEVRKSGLATTAPDFLDKRHPPER